MLHIDFNEFEEKQAKRYDYKRPMVCCTCLDPIRSLRSAYIEEGRRGRRQDAKREKPTKAVSRIFCSADCFIEAPKLKPTKEDLSG